MLYCSYQGKTSGPSTVDPPIMCGLANNRSAMLEVTPQSTSATIHFNRLIKYLKININRLECTVDGIEGGNRREGNCKKKTED